MTAAPSTTSSAPTSGPARGGQRFDPTSPRPDGRRAPATTWIAVTAAVACAAPAWMTARAFSGSAPTAILLGLSVGAVVLALLAGRGPRPLLTQLLAPVLAIGVAYAATESAAAAPVTQAVWDAVASGQFVAAPIAFSPPWQLLTSVLTVCLGVGAVYAVLATGDLRLPVVMAAPVVVALAVIQSTDRLLTSTLPALLLLLVALALAQHGEQARHSADPLPFGVGEAVRLGVVLAVVTASVVGAAKLGLLGTSAVQDADEPPRPPAAARITTTDPLFVVRSPRPMPLRLGVLDSYDGTRWLTPALTPRRAVDVGDGSLGEPAAGVASVATMWVTVASAQVGRVLPLSPGVFSVIGLPTQASVLPGRSSVRAPVAAEPGLAYSVRVSLPDPSALAQLTYAPHRESVPPPPGVARLLAEQPPTATPWRTLQSLRAALFASGAQAGAGEPVPVTPARVDELLGGATGTGFELAAADAALARWSGLESRIGYGYLRRQAAPDGSYPISRADGASWVELKTAAGGWVPLTDRPAGSAAPPAAVTTVAVPDGRRYGQLFVPLQRADEVQLSRSVRYWAVAYGSVLLCGVVLWLLVPALLRAVRARRRRSWAAARGPRERIAVAYASLREAAIDHHVGSPTQTPLEFLDCLERDDDHVELAWLVERALWGDLRRDLTDADADAAERLAGSLRKRLVGGQPFTQRVLGFASHASLRRGWQPDLPTAYPRWWGSTLRVQPGRRARMALSLLAIVLLATLPLLIGVQRPDLRSDPRAATRLPVVPTAVGPAQLSHSAGADAPLSARRERALLDATRLYLVKLRGVAQGTLQTGVIKTGVAGDSVAVRSALLTELGMTDVTRIGRYVVYSRDLGALRQSLWMSPDGMSFQLLTTSATGLPAPRELLAKIVAAGRGDTDTGALLEPVMPPDERRGPDLSGPVTDADQAAQGGS